MTSVLVSQVKSDRVEFWPFHFMSDLVQQRLSEENTISLRREHPKNPPPAKVERASAISRPPEDIQPGVKRDVRPIRFDAREPKPTAEAGIILKLPSAWSLQYVRPKNSSDESVDRPIIPNWMLAFLGKKTRGSDITAGYFPRRGLEVFKASPSADPEYYIVEGRSTVGRGIPKRDDIRIKRRAPGAHSNPDSQQPRGIGRGSVPLVSGQHRSTFPISGGRGYVLNLNHWDWSKSSKERRRRHWFDWIWVSSSKSHGALFSLIGRCLKFR